MSLNTLRLFAPTFPNSAALTYLTAASALILSIPTLTFLLTFLRFRLQCLGDRRFKGKEPPTLPYWIPFVGSALGMVRNPHGFYKGAMFVCTSTLYSLL